jgi:hypothetical protein
MTETERLLLRTLEDIETRVKSHDPYEVLGLSALIRKLFLDDNPLIDQVNRMYRQKIKFVISDPNSPYTQLVLSMKPSFYSVQDGLDPETALTNKAKIEVNRDQFFGTMVLMIEGKPYSVREVILFEANVMGGIHAGAPKTDKERALAEINNLYVGGDTRAATRQLQGISRVVIKALQPLREAIHAAA